MILFAGKNLGSFKSFSGSILDIQCHQSEPLVASCGQDRFLRIHHVDSRQLVHKVYIYISNKGHMQFCLDKSRANQVLF